MLHRGVLIPGVAGYFAWGCFRYFWFGAANPSNAVLADPVAKKRFAEIGAFLLPGSAADFGKLLADETEKWGKVVKFSGARAD
jgi:hypothetical protein